MFVSMLITTVLHIVLSSLRHFWCILRREKALLVRPGNMCKNGIAKQAHEWLVNGCGGI